MASSHLLAMHRANNLSGDDISFIQIMLGIYLNLSSCLHAGTDIIFPDLCRRENIESDDNRPITSKIQPPNYLEDTYMYSLSSIHFIHFTICFGSDLVTFQMTQKSEPPSPPRIGSSNPKTKQHACMRQESRQRAAATLY